MEIVVGSKSYGGREESLGSGNCSSRDNLRCFEDGFLRHVESGPGFGLGGDVCAEMQKARSENSFLCWVKRSLKTTVKDINNILSLPV